MTLIVILMICIMAFATYVGLKEDDGAKKGHHINKTHIIETFEELCNNENNRWLQEEQMRNALAAHDRLFSQHLNDLHNMGML